MMLKLTLMLIEVASRMLVLLSLPSSLLVSHVLCWTKPWRRPRKLQEPSIELRKTLLTMLPHLLDNCQDLQVLLKTYWEKPWPQLPLSELLKKNSSWRLFHSDKSKDLPLPLEWWNWEKRWSKTLKISLHHATQPLLPPLQEREISDQSSSKLTKRWEKHHSNSSIWLPLRDNSSSSELSKILYFIYVVIFTEYIRSKTILKIPSSPRFLRASSPSTKSM